MPHLHVVSDLGYQEYVSFFLQDSTMINQKDSHGNIPLHLACMKGHIEIVQNLIENKSSIDIANNEGLKPFVYACEINATAVAKVLLHHCGKWINVNEKYQKRNNGSVLHIVCAKGFVNLVLLLLNHNAKVDLLDGSGCIPLHVANSSAVVKALLDYNANINQVDFFEKAEINQKTKTELRPLHAACQSESIEIVKILIENGARINSAKPCISPLHEACRIGNESIVNFLIESNASINHKTKDGLTPLHQACMNDRVIVAKKLLDNKVNVNDESKYGWTALYFSSAKGFRTIVDLLLQHGANVNIWDEDKVSPLMAACKENKTDVVDLLLHSKANVNHCDKDNCSSLLVACKSGNVDLVNLLLTYGADINLVDTNMISPLHAACMNNNNTKLVLKLVESNANVNVADKTDRHRYLNQFSMDMLTL
ncbi:unnamed protein product [Mytilus edulis]|uniref:Uncharacterized protein n=1 Tax=Mytilus edulis TaxID=6550 RepID=A0A8S3SXK7_MYTED|nr:unnamed protein product [Mytilus edulis]